MYISVPQTALLSISTVLIYCTQQIKTVARPFKKSTFTLIKLIGTSKSTKNYFLCFKYTISFIKSLRNHADTISIEE